ncbi:hypothetical protein C8R47DRAFT_1131112 [Mycena vitilis]|nr:hypothetical protein C8R47DRAFT_1131112 [Mycena vitilis]
MRKVFFPEFQDGGEASRSLLVEPNTPGATADASGSAVYEAISTPTLAEDVVSSTATFDTVGSPLLFPAFSIPIGDTSSDGPFQSTPAIPSATSDAVGLPIVFPSFSNGIEDASNDDIEDALNDNIEYALNDDIEDPFNDGPSQFDALFAAATRDPAVASISSPAASQYAASDISTDCDQVSPAASSSSDDVNKSPSASLRTDEPLSASFKGARETPQPETVHELLLSRMMMALFPSVPKGISSRSPRIVELRLPPPVREIVFWPGMGRKLVDYLRAKPGEDLSTLHLTPELYRRLMAGPTIANCSKKVASEADVEHAMKVGQCTVVAEIINYQDDRFGLEHEDRLYPRRGTPGTQPGQKSHAFSDIVLEVNGPGEKAKKEEAAEIPPRPKKGGAIEMKTNVTINKNFIPTLFKLPLKTINQLIEDHPDAGFKFAYNYPRLCSDLMPPVAQPLIQIWTQMHENLYNFGEGSSHEHSFFVMRDPENPNRLIVSSCYQTPFIPVSESDRPIPNSDDPSESVLYIMYSLFRIANKPAHQEKTSFPILGAIWFGLSD